jgi:26S proteasome regulatory subunit N3
VRGSQCLDHALTSTAIKTNFTLLERGVAQFDSRFTLRALRSISLLRKRLTGEILGKIVATTYPGNGDGETPSVLFKAIGMDETGTKKAVDEWKRNTVTKEPIPAIDIYLAILIQVCLLTSLDSYSYSTGILV